MKMSINKNIILGLFEIQFSYSITVNLIERNKFNHVYFTPYITIISKCKEHIEFIKNELGINSTILIQTHKSKNSISKSYKLALQDEDNVKIITKFLKNYSFISKQKQKSFELFLLAIKKIKEIGYSHTIFSDKFEEILKLKDKINNTHKKSSSRFSVDEWMNKIEDHLTK